jgi:hypothetical protein
MPLLVDQDVLCLQISMTNSASNMKAIPDDADQLVENLANEADILYWCGNVRQRDVFLRKVLDEIEMVSRFDPALPSNQAWMRRNLSK